MSMLRKTWTPLHMGGLRTSILSRHYSMGHHSGETNHVAEGAGAPVEAEAEAQAEALEHQAADAVKLISSNVVEETNLHPTLKRAFAKTIGPTLTPVQEQCINDFVSSEHGIVVRAKTGTGKTFAFGLPVIHSVLKSRERDVKFTDKYVNSVIFAPTRDLATQIRKSISTLWDDCGARKFPRDSSNYRLRIPRNWESIPLVIGQTPYRQTMDYFPGRSAPPIVVATPGRFMDALENRQAFRDSLVHLENIIIDEADELLNGNFKEDINNIIDELNAIRKPIKGVEEPGAPVKPKTMLFSATVSDDVFELAERAIGPEFPFVDVTGAKTEEVNENITQILVQTESIYDSYIAAVSFILDNQRQKNFKPIIFLSTTSSVDFFAKLFSDILRAEGCRRRVLPFHGKLPQGKRDNSQKIFRESSNAILVASGIGARGMDFPGVTHVIQIGVSSEIDSHTHKIGRTGRAGKKGEALLFTSKLEEPFVKALIKNGNKFGETIEFDSTTPEALDVAEKIKKQTNSYLDLDETFLKNLSHYRNIPSKIAKLNQTALAMDVAKTYSALSGEAVYDEDEEPVKLTMSYNMADKMGLKWEELEDYYNFTGRRPQKSKSGSFNGRNNNRQSKGNWSNNRSERGGYRDSNRGGYRNDHRDSYKSRSNRNSRNSDRWEDSSEQRW